MAGTAVDHLIVAAAALAQGCDWVESGLGVRPQPGGRHDNMGTHNALLRIGPRRYLEVIAIDPEAPAPTRERWFDLDEPRMRAMLAEGPRLVHFVARTDDIDAQRAKSAVELGNVTSVSRGDMRWRMTIPADGHLPGRGLVPTLIEWPPGARHPAEMLPELGLSIVALAGEHPDPAPIRAALARLALDEDVKVTFGQSPRLAAMIRTPRGVVAL